MVSTDFLAFSKRNIRANEMAQCKVAASGESHAATNIKQGQAVSSLQTALIEDCRRFPLGMGAGRLKS